MALTRITIRQFEVFVTVADMRGFAAASERNRLTLAREMWLAFDGADGANGLARHSSPAWTWRRTSALRDARVMPSAGTPITTPRPSIAPECAWAGVADTSIALLDRWTSARLCTQ